MPIIKNKRNIKSTRREITKTTSPTQNRFISEKENAEKRNKALKLIASKTGIGKKSLENNINRIAAQKSLNVKKTSSEIAKARIDSINRKIMEINFDKNIESKQKKFYINLLEKQIETIKEKYLTKK